MTSPMLDEYDDTDDQESGGFFAELFQTVLAAVEQALTTMPGIPSQSSGGGGGRGGVGGRKKHHHKPKKGTGDSGGMGSSGSAESGGVRPFEPKGTHHHRKSILGGGGGHASTPSVPQLPDTNRSHPNHILPQIDTSPPAGNSGQVAVDPGDGSTQSLPDTLKQKAQGLLDMVNGQRGPSKSQEMTPGAVQKGQFDIGRTPAPKAGVMAPGGLPGLGGWASPSTQAKGGLFTGGAIQPDTRPQNQGLKSLLTGGEIGKAVSATPPAALRSQNTPGPSGVPPAAASSDSSWGGKLGSAAQFTRGKINEMLGKAGFSPSQYPTMRSIITSESQGNAAAVGPRNSNGTIDRGLAQINSVHSQYDAGRLTSDPQYNLNAAHDIYKSQGYGAWSETHPQNPGYAQWQKNLANENKLGVGPTGVPLVKGTPGSSMARTVPTPTVAPHTPVAQAPAKAPISQLAHNQTKAASVTKPPAPGTATQQSPARHATGRATAQTQHSGSAGKAATSHPAAKSGASHPAKSSSKSKSSSSSKSKSTSKKSKSKSKKK